MLSKQGKNKLREITRVWHSSGTVLSISRVQVLCNQRLIVPQADSLKIEKRRMLRNTPQEFFTSVLTPDPNKSDSSAITRGSKTIPRLFPNTHWWVATDHNRRQKHKQYFSFFFTHIFQPPVGLLMPARGNSRKQRCECVFVCVNDNERTEGLLVRVSVLGSERAGKWEHNPDYSQP